MYSYLNVVIIVKVCSLFTICKALSIVFFLPDFIYEVNIKGAFDVYFCWKYVFVLS